MSFDVTAIVLGTSSPTVNSTFCNPPFQLNNSDCVIPGVREIVEVAFIFVFMIIGTFGNFLVIFSIIFAKTAFTNGNIFIINLAVADLTVSGFFLPTVLLNVLHKENALPDTICHFAGYMVTVACACSVWSMAFIALNRFIYVVHNQLHRKFCSKTKSILMVVFVWFWSHIIVSPTLLGWSRLVYDDKMAQCSWDDQASIVYNVLLIACALLVPLGIIVFCYWRLYKYVQKKGRWNIKENVKGQHKIQNRSRMRREVALLKTLAVTVGFFVFCWTPYGTIVIFFAHNVPPGVKKMAARLGLFNSSINFIIYGIMNETYRQGYINFLIYLSCCKKSCRRMVNRAFPDRSISNVARIKTIYQVGRESSPSGNTNFVTASPQLSSDKFAKRIVQCKGTEADRRVT